jgi:hypothetical protein
MYFWFAYFCNTEIVRQNGTTGNLHMAAMRGGATQAADHSAERLPPGQRTGAFASAAGNLHWSLHRAKAFDRIA